MDSVAALMQMMMVFSMILVLWDIYGYSLAAAFTAGINLPEQVFVVFQSTFAGITGALLTGVLSVPALGSGNSTILQQLGVGITLAWSGLVSMAAYFVVKLLFGLRESTEAEREGLDITSHGESAYESGYRRHAL